MLCHEVSRLWVVLPLHFICTILYFFKITGMIIPSRPLQFWSSMATILLLILTLHQAIRQSAAFLSLLLFYTKSTAFTLLLFNSKQRHVSSLKEKKKKSTKVTTLSQTCEGTFFGGSMRMEGSHSPGGRTVT